jgi:hypothetical protein
LGTAGFFLGGLSDTLASIANPVGSLWNLSEASYTVAQRDGDVAGVAYGLGSLIGLTQITEAVAGENFLTGQALTGLDRWGTAFQGISVLSGDAALGVGVAGQLDFSGLFGRTNADLVQEIGTRADAWATRQGLTGTPQQLGTWEHGYAQRLLIRYQSMFGDRGLSTEVRYLNGNLWRPGNPLTGSVRLDVVEGPLNNPSWVWDYKFGDSQLTPARISQIRAGAGLGSNVPVDEVRP